MKRIYRIAGVGLMTATMLLASPVYAHNGEDHGTSEKQANSAEAGAKTQAEAERKKVLQEQAEAKRKAMQAQIEQKKQEIKAKLTDQRLKLCQQRQETINKVVDSSKTRAQHVLEKLQSAESRVRGYYASKNLSLSNHDELSAAMDEKEAAAVAAVSVTGQTNFDCATDDAARPAGIVSDTVRAQHDALKAYRLSIRDFIAAIRETTKTTEGN